MTERMCFIKDDSGHWFLIKAHSRELFGQLLDKIGMGEDTKETWDQWAQFKMCRPPQFFTFADPQED